VNHADVGGWAGDLVDLLSTTDRLGLKGETFEDRVAHVSNNYLCKNPGGSDLFTQEDMWGDLDAFYIMQKMPSAAEYEEGDMTAIMKA